MDTWIRGILPQDTWNSYIVDNFMLFVLIDFESNKLDIYTIGAHTEMARNNSSLNDCYSMRLQNPDYGQLNIT